MRISIYQIDPERDTNRVRYLSYRGMSKIQGYIDPKIYDKVFEGDVEANDLEDVFRFFNSAILYGYHGRAMSVSDVVETVDAETGELHWWCCDSIGFLNIDSEWISGLEIFDKTEFLYHVSDLDIKDFCFGGD